MTTNADCKCPCGESVSFMIGKYKGDTTFPCDSLYRCEMCSLVFAYPMPDEKTLNKYYSNGLYYDQISDPYNQDVLEFSKRIAFTRLELIFDKTNLINRRPKVVDIGAGNARFGMALKKSNTGAIYDAVEPNMKVMEEYGGWVNKKYQNISEIQEIDYDLVVMNQILEHIPNPFIFLKTISRLIKLGGYIYIDVPFKDYLFKQSLEPHLLFWNQQSILFFLEKVGMKLLFCDTAGMTHKQAKRFFNQQTLIDKILNPWSYVNKINRLMNKIGAPKVFDTYRKFSADQYGGDRQWLRCIAQKNM